jgi:hypothetical protein
VEVSGVFGLSCTIVASNSEAKADTVVEKDMSEYCDFHQSPHNRNNGRVNKRRVFSTKPLVGQHRIVCRTNEIRHGLPCVCRTANHTYDSNHKWSLKSRKKAKGSAFSGFRLR